MNSRRFIAMLLLAAWWCGVGSYWYWNVPLAATNWARKTRDADVTTLNANEEMPMTHLRWADDARKRTVRCGPLEFWSFPECRKTRELFTREDDFVAGPLARTREVMIRRRGRLLIVDSESGETIGDIGDVPKARAFAMVPDKTQVLVSGGDEVSLFEVGADEPLWTLPQCTFQGQVAGDIAIVSRRTPTKSGFGRSQWTAVRLATGEFDPRFDHLGRLGEIKLSTDGRLAIAWQLPVLPKPGSPGVRIATSRCVVCDARTGEVRWTLPSIFRNEPMFWANDEEVQAQLISLDGAFVVRRWRASDGEPLPDPTPDECAPLRWGLSSDGSYALHHINDYDSAFQRTISRFNNFVGAHGLHFFINPNSQRVSVREVATGRIAGPLPAKATNVWLPKDGGLVSIDQDFIRYYRMPPGRDLWWLARWGVLPPVGLMLVFAGLVRIRWGKRWFGIGSARPAE